MKSEILFKGRTADLLSKLLKIHEISKKTKERLFQRFGVVRKLIHDK